ncbi:MAG: hypothetical protein JJT89_11275 [Nitriliruptoraceae bacterium]|nr:hypothetical protein [Nitriliruptoraceae bacterium]
MSDDPAPGPAPGPGPDHATPDATARLTRADLAALGQGPDDDRRPRLQARGLVGADGTPSDGLGAALAGAMAAARLRLTLRRAGRVGRAAVEVIAGPGGLVVVPGAEVTDEVEVGWLPATALARTIWRLAQLDPRRMATRATVVGDAVALGAPFDTPADPGWLRDLDVDHDRATLTRIDVLPDDGGPSTSIAFLDDGRGLWQLLATDDVWRADPVAAEELWRGFAGWQRAVLDRRDGGLGALSDTAVVDLGDAQLRIPVGADWRGLEPAVVGVPTDRLHGWSAAPASGFAANVTVALTGGSSGEPIADALEVADALSGGRPIAVHTDPVVAVIVHESPSGDVVTVQRALPFEQTVAVVSYTVSAEGSTDDLPVLRDAITRLEIHAVADSTPP